MIGPVALFYYCKRYDLKEMGLIVGHMVVEQKKIVKGNKLIEEGNDVLCMNQRSS